MKPDEKKTEATNDTQDQGNNTQESKTESSDAQSLIQSKDNMTSVAGTSVNFAKNATKNAELVNLEKTDSSDSNNDSSSGE